MHSCGAEIESNKKLENLLLYGSEDFKLERHEKLTVVILLNLHNDLLPPFFDYNTFWIINRLICTFPIPTVLITSYNWHRATKDSFGRFSTTKSEFTENPHGIKSWQFWKLEITPCNFHHVLVESTRNHLIDIFAW